MTAEFEVNLAKADRMLREGRPAEAEELFTALLGAGASSGDREKGLALSGRGMARCQLGRHDAADNDLREAWELLKAAYGETSSPAAVTQVFLGRVQTARGDIDAGARTGREALRILDETLDETDPLVAEACFLLSQAEYQLNNLDAAEALTRRAMSIWEKRQGPENVAISTCLNNLGRIYEERGMLQKGINFHRQCLDLRRKLLGEHPETAFSLGNLGTALAAAENWPEAAEILRECVECYSRLGISAPQVEGYRRNLEVCRMALADSENNAPSA